MVQPYEEDAQEIIEDLNPSLEQAQFHFSTQDQADDIKEPKPPAIHF